MTRSIKACMNCGDNREIAAHGLCFKCYRQEERKLADELWAKPDANAKEVAKAQRKTRKALMKMMDALEELQTGKLVPEATVESWRVLLRPEVARIALCLGEAQVNKEHEELRQSFVESADERSEAVNTEQEKESERLTELADPVNSEQEDVRELFTDPTSRDGEQVNSEPEKASEQFTQPSESLNQSIRSELLPAELSGTEPPSLLPPTVPQRITKLKKEKGNSHAA
jgi:hypothetical protein